ncbi:hypothetical protein HK104_007595 [Borealophlyctis nickersoniae]|nr:hypothetical protein HK104_007595 [Borealophlyctis nickersoniae]
MKPLSLGVTDYHPSFRPCLDMTYNLLFSTSNTPGASVHVWDLSRGTHLYDLSHRILSRSEMFITSMYLSTDGGSCLAVSCENGDLCVYDFGPGPVERRVERMEREEDWGAKKMRRCVMPTWVCCGLNGSGDGRKEKIALI